VRSGGSSGAGGQIDRSLPDLRRVTLLVRERCAVGMTPEAVLSAARAACPL
jgi:hypothetical protein